MAKKKQPQNDTSAIPSSLDLERRASAARSGREHQLERMQTDAEAVIAGDLDANQIAATAIGDETPGGDNSTPDQNVGSEIGRAVGVIYQDNEELKAVEKIAERDRRRWEDEGAPSDDERDH